MKKLGFGLMRLPRIDPSDRASIDIETMKTMVDEFIAAGFTYFDTAWMYCGFNSERAVKEALTSGAGLEKFRAFVSGQGGDPSALPSSGLKNSYITFLTVSIT